MKPEKIKEDFPIFQEKPNLSYLDNAATSQKPRKVLESIKRFYEKNNSNVGRGLYDLASETTKKYEESRSTVANFINAKPEEIIFVRNTTEAQNLLASSLEIEGNIVLSKMSHHSEQLPWREKENKLEYLKTEKGKISLKDAEDKINKNTGLVVIPHISNVFGVENPVDKLVQLARNNDALVILDCAQSAPHKKINVKDLDVDFLTFSGHKMLAPTGIGVLYGKKDLLTEMKPYQVGGGMVESVTFNEVNFKKPPHKFEAGTPNIAGAIGLKSAIEYLEEKNLNEVNKHIKKLSKKITNGLNKIENVKVISPEGSTIVSFTIDGIHAHDIAEVLNQSNVAVRAGNHCTQPQHKEFNIRSTVRASPYLYNTEKDVEKLLAGLEEVIKTFDV